MKVHELKILDIHRLTLEALKRVHDAWLIESDYDRAIEDLAMCSDLLSEYAVAVVNRKEASCPASTCPTAAQ